MGTMKDTNGPNLDLKDIYGDLKNKLAGGAGLEEQGANDEHYGTFAGESTSEKSSGEENSFEI